MARYDQSCPPQDPWCDSRGRLTVLRVWALGVRQLQPTQRQFNSTLALVVLRKIRFFHSKFGYKGVVLAPLCPNLGFALDAKAGLAPLCPVAWPHFTCDSVHSTSNLCAWLVDRSWSRLAEHNAKAMGWCPCTWIGILPKTRAYPPHYSPLCSFAMTPSLICFLTCPSASPGSS